MFGDGNMKIAKSHCGQNRADICAPLPPLQLRGNGVYSDDLTTERVNQIDCEIPFVCRRCRPWTVSCGNVCSPMKSLSFSIFKFNPSIRSNRFHLDNAEADRFSLDPLCILILHFFHPSPPIISAALDFGRVE